jgi:CBS domain containing-hemolysin-like protein
MNWPLIILVFGFGLALSFFLSGMEAGVFELSRLRIRHLMRAGQPRARALYGYLEKPENFLWTILVGNTLANFVGVSLLVFVLHWWFHEHPPIFLLCFVLAVFSFYAGCDLLPKMLFRLYPNRLCLMLAIPFRFVHVVLAPLVAVVTRLADGLLRWTGGRMFTGHLFANRDELRLVMQESAQGLTSEERAMINQVLDLQNLRLRQVTVPLDKIISVAAQTPMSEVLKICAEKKLTRLPVWQSEASSRRIVGIVSLNTLLYLTHLDLSKTAGDYVKPALYLDEDMRLEEALQRMQKSGQRLAIVLGLDRHELGLVTLQDILKAIFGEVNL